MNCIYFTCHLEFFGISDILVNPRTLFLTLLSISLVLSLIQYSKLIIRTFWIGWQTIKDDEDRPEE